MARIIRLYSRFRGGHDAGVDLRTDYGLLPDEVFPVLRTLAGRRRMAIAFLIGFLALPVIALNVVVDQHPASIAITVLTIAAEMALVLFVRRSLKRDAARLLLPDSVHLTDDDVEMVTGDRATTVGWSHVTGLKATPEFWLLHTGEGRVLALPRRLFTADQQTEIDTFFPRVIQGTLQAWQRPRPDVPS
ncbi:YcxB family protein [Nonomuraea sp. CA-141351]|uniref:YcxB family protein n=1 Tax=Nonomuraea sp. CA-141351 TaxID=3239996 RepID=UPI003D913BFC